MKKLLTVLLSVAMVVTLMPAMAFAGAVDHESEGDCTCEAKIGDQHYATLADAVEEAEADETVTLLKEVELSSQLNISDAITLDGNGKTVKAKADVSWPATSGSAKHLVNITAGATINDVVFDCNGTYGVQTYSSALADWVASFKNVTINNSLGAGLTVNATKVNAESLATSGNTWGAVNVDKGGAFDLDTMKSMNEAVQVWTEKPQTTGDNPSDNTEVKITILDCEKPVVGGYGEDGVLKGFNYYTTDVSKLGEATIEDEAGNTTVYVTLKDAIAKAEAGDTVKLEKDVVIAENTITDPNTGIYTITKDLTINGNGKKIEAAFDGSDGELWPKPGESRDTDPSIFNVENCNVTFDNITINGGDVARHGINIWSNNPENKAEVIINNSEIANCEGYGIVCVGSEVTVDNIVTKGNGTGGINVDTSESSKLPSNFEFVSGTVNEELAVNVEKSYTTEENATVTISGGEFKGEVVVADKADTDEDVDGVELNITAGSFVNPVNNYIANDKTAASVTTSSEKTTYYVGEADKVAEIIESTVEQGDTIVVQQGDVELKDVPADVTVKNEGEGQVNVNDKTVETGKEVIVEKPVQPKPPTGGGSYDPLATSKTDAIKAVEDFVKLADYDAAEQAVIKDILAQAKKDISAAKTKDDIKAIEDAVKAELDKVLTTIEKEEADKAEQAAKEAKIKLGVKGTTIKLTSELVNGKIELNWTKSLGYKVDYYEVFKSTKRYSGFGTKAYFKTTTGGIDNWYKNTKELKKGARYYYKVRGVREVNGEKVYTKDSNKAWRLVK